LLPIPDPGVKKATEPDRQHCFIYDYLAKLCDRLFHVQIPPPKAPLPEMHFIPNPANTEFIYLTGLEECVKRILNLDANPPPMPMPFTCSQCSTDFTPT
jgi:hypothetical protein